jgi:hypothetical protein
MRRLLVLLAFAPACLSRPPGRSQPPPLGPWPPPGIALDIVAARVVDQDGDGIDDLVLASAAPDAPAIYVLLGSIDGIGAGYHAHVATVGVPLALAVGDLDGDHRSDLVALEHVDQPTELEPIELFPATDLVAFGPSWRKDTTELSSLSVGNAALDLVDFTGDGTLDLFLADQLHVYTGRVTAPTGPGFRDMDVAPLVPNPDGFAQPASAFVAPAAGGGTNLVVVAGLHTDVYARIDQGQTAAPHATTHVPFNTHAACDVDGDHALEVVGGAGNWAVDLPWPVDRSVNFNDVPPLLLNGPLPSAVCAQLDGDVAGRLDLAVLQQDPASVHVLRDLQLGAALTSARASALDCPLPAGTIANVMVAGDFNGDGKPELIVVARTGAITDLTIGTDAIAPCAP